MSPALEAPNTGFSLPPMATQYPIADPLVPPAIGRAQTSDRSPIYLAVLLGYILLLPPQFNLTIGGSVLPPYRLFLIPAALFVMRSALRGHLRFAWSDLAITGAALWIVLSLFVTSKASDAITSVAAQFCDIALAYWFGRAALRNLQDLRIFLLLLAPGLGLTAIIIAVESVTKTHLLQPFVAALTGQGYFAESPTRLGLLRAKGPFPHSILGGLFLASFLPLYALSGLRGWPRLTGFAASLASFFALSSAAFLALGAGLALLVYNWLSEQIRNLTWRLFFLFAGLFVFVAELGTNSGSYSLIMRFASFNSHNGYYRLLIWRHGINNVEKNPWFGIGYTEWERPAWMPGSIDHFWLMLAVQFGALAPLLIILGVTIAVIQLARSASGGARVDQRLRRGLAISLSVFAIGLASVSIWLSAQVWFFMLLGICATMVGAATSQPRMLPVPPPERAGEK